MIVAKKPILDPYAPYDPYAAQDEKSLLPTAPDSGGGWTPPAPDPISPPLAPTAPEPLAPAPSPAPPPSRMPAPTTTPTEPQLPQQLPTGDGGVIPVPPPRLGPPPSPTPIAPIVPDQPIEPAPPPPRLLPGGGPRLPPPMTPPPPTDTTPWELPPPSGPIGIGPEGPTDTTPWELPIDRPFQPLPKGEPLPGRPPAEPAAPAVPGVAPELPTFGPDDNLINKEIAPGSDPRLMNLQGLTDDILKQMTSGPNRFDIAKQYWDEFQKETQGDYDRSFTDARNEAAAHGRLKSGMLTNTYGDLSERRARDLDVARSRYLTDALSGTIQDTRNRFTDASGAEAQAFGEGASNRNEMRGERGYQQGMAEQALIRRIMQQAAEAGLDSQQFQQLLQMFGAGNSGDPTGALETGAATAAGEAGSANSDIAALLALLARRNNGGT